MKSNGTEGPRKLEIIGDSAAAGVGPSATGAALTCGDEDAYLAWGSIIARALGASSVSVALSVAGVDPAVVADPMSAIYPRTVLSFPTSVYDFATKPDAVVIELGFDDFTAGDPASTPAHLRSVSSASSSSP